MTEKEVIEAYYERLRQEQKANGTYDPSHAQTNGLAHPDWNINSENIIHRNQWGGWPEVIRKRYNGLPD